MPVKPWHGFRQPEAERNTRVVGRARTSARTPSPAGGASDIDAERWDDAADLVAIATSAYALAGLSSTSVACRISSHPLRRHEIYLADADPVSLGEVLPARGR